MLYKVDEVQDERAISHHKFVLTKKDNKLSTQMTECFIGPKELNNDDDDFDQFDLDELEMEMDQA